MDAQERILTVTNYGDEDDETLRTRVTLAPHRINIVVASEEPNRMVDSRELHKVNVLFDDGTNMELFITLLDLNTIERAIGTYLLPF